jgi:hypothetical protein
MFQSLVEERVRERHVVSFDQALPTEGERDRDAARLLESVSDNLRSHEEEMRRAVEQPGALDPEREFGGLGTRGDLRRHVSGRLARDLAFNPSKLRFPTGPLFAGNAFISPPYAQEWQSGAGLAFGAVADGRLTTVGAQGVSVAGVNLYLTSNMSTEVSAAITPLGTFQWNWVTFENLPTLQTMGGLGFNVVHNGTEITRHEPAMWSQSGATAFSGQTAEDHLWKAASMPSGPFGPLQLFPVVINMQPSEQYLFALWCWQVAHYPEDAAFLGFMNAQMTGVMLSVGPPIHLT